MTSRSERGRPAGRPRFAAAALAAVAVAALAAGCGSDDGDSTTSDARAEFIAQADQICAAASDRINTKAKQRQLETDQGVTDPAKVVDLYTEVTIPELERMFDQIGALTPPPGDEDEIDAILDAGDQAIAESKQNPKDLAKPIGTGNPFEQVNELEQAYGFEVCGGGNN